MIDMISTCIDCENCVFCSDEDIKKYARSRDCKRFVESRCTTLPGEKYYYFTGNEIGILVYYKHRLSYDKKTKKRVIKKIKRLYNVELKNQPTEDFDRNTFITDLNGAIILNNALKELKHGKK